MTTPSAIAGRLGRANFGGFSLYEEFIDGTSTNRVSQKFALMEFSEIRVRKESYFWLYKP
jgi:hypothetical protein